MPWVAAALRWLGVFVAIFGFICCFYAYVAKWGTLGEFLRGFMLILFGGLIFHAGTLCYGLIL